MRNPDGEVDNIIIRSSGSLFRVGDEVEVPRSRGGTSRAEIISIQEGKATVYWRENGKDLKKTIDVRRLNPKSGQQSTH